MDTKRILVALSLSVVTLFAHPSAKEIYQESTKVLSFNKIKFHVTSKMQSGAYSQEQLFSVARIGNAKKSTSLICFLLPKSIKGTAILLKKEPHNSTTLVYFPSIGRSRLIPKEHEKDEALGLGLSFSEIQNNSKHLSYLGEVSQNGTTFYKIQKQVANERTLYLIAKDDMVLRDMQIFDKKTRIKEIHIKKFISLHGKMLITAWEIKDYLKNKQTLYTVDTNSIMTTFNKRIFKKSALSHCRP